MSQNRVTKISGDPNMKSSVPLLNSTISTISESKFPFEKKLKEQTRWPRHTTSNT